MHTGLFLSSRVFIADGQHHHTFASHTKYRKKPGRHPHTTTLQLPFSIAR